MRARTVRFTSLLFVVAVLISAHVAAAQASASAKDPLRPELELGYAYMHSNAPVGECGCFSLNGGNATFAFPLRYPGISLVGDIGVTHSGGVAGSGLDLTLSTYTAGARYTFNRMHRPIKPFAQVLLGVAHSSGSLVTGSDSNVGNSGAAFTSLVGGGVDLRVSHRFSIRMIEADYLVTTFDNGSNDHQNNLRIDTGVIVRF